MSKRSLRLIWGLALGWQVCFAGQLLGQGVEVFVSPAAQTVNVGAAVSVQIRVNTNALDVCLGGVFLQFDTLRLQFVSGANNTATWTSGNFNVEPAQHQPGIISLNVGGASAVNGNNLLVSTLNFTALNTGSAPLTLLFNAGAEVTEFFASDCIAALTTNGSGGVVSIQAPTDTPTPTLTPTNSPSPTSTPTATPTVTPPFADTDGDGIPDASDNCPYTSNPGQEDTGGIGATSGPDGIGDACQCGDVNGNGRVTLADSVIILRSLLVPPTATQMNPQLCDVGGPPGCSLADAVIILRANLSPPTATVLQHCAPANP